MGPSFACHRWKCWSHTATKSQTLVSGLPETPRVTGAVRHTRRRGCASCPQTPAAILHALHCEGSHTPPKGAHAGGAQRSGPEDAQGWTLRRAGRSEETGIYASRGRGREGPARHRWLRTHRDGSPHSRPPPPVFTTLTEPAGPRGLGENKSHLASRPAQVRERSREVVCTCWKPRENQSGSAGSGVASCACVVVVWVHVCF